MLEAELDDSLGHTKNDMESNNTENRRNDHSKKIVRSEYGEMELEIPRDRDGEFEPAIVKKHHENVSGIEESIIALYSKEMTARDIQEHLSQFYGVEVSPAMISNVTNRLMPLIKEWEGRLLQGVYAIVFLYAIHFKIRQEVHIVNYDAPYRVRHKLS